MNEEDIFIRGLHVAKTYDVATPENQLVVYSMTGQSTKANRELAFAYVGEHPGAMMIDHTPCGAKLIEIGFMSDTGLHEEQTTLVWKEASKRVVEQASGNVTAFVDYATPEGVFRSMELPMILSNPQIETINEIDKFKFAKRFED